MNCSWFLPSCFSYFTMLFTVDQSYLVSIYKNKHDKSQCPARTLTPAHVGKPTQTLTHTQKKLKHLTYDTSTQQSHLLMLTAALWQHYGAMEWPYPSCGQVWKYRQLFAVSVSTWLTKVFHGWKLHVARHHAYLHQHPQFPILSTRSQLMVKLTIMWCSLVPCLESYWQLCADFILRHYPVHCQNSEHVTSSTVQSIERDSWTS